MRTKRINWESHPVGKRVRRVAKVRRAHVQRIALGRERATEALLAIARNRAIPRHMPAGIHTVTTVTGRIREAVLNLAAKAVARSIERQTFNAAFNRLEASKIGGRKWESGIWYLICVMKGTVLP